MLKDKQAGSGLHKLGSAMSSGCCLQSNISHHKSNALPRERDQVLREAEPLSAAQMDSVLEECGIPDFMRARVLRRLRPK